MNVSSERYANGKLNAPSLTRDRIDTQLDNFARRSVFASGYTASLISLSTSFSLDQMNVLNSDISHEMGLLSLIGLVHVTAMNGIQRVVEMKRIKKTDEYLQKWLENHAIDEPVEIIRSTSPDNTHILYWQPDESSSDKKDLVSRAYALSYAADDNSMRIGIRHDTLPGLDISTIDKSRSPLSLNKIISDQKLRPSLTVEGGANSGGRLVDVMNGAELRYLLSQQEFDHSSFERYIRLLSEHQGVVESIRMYEAEKNPQAWIRVKNEVERLLSYAAPEEYGRNADGRKIQRYYTGWSNTGNVDMSFDGHYGRLSIAKLAGYQSRLELEQAIDTMTVDNKNVFSVASSLWLQLNDETQVAEIPDRESNHAKEHQGTPHITSHRAKDFSVVDSHTIKRNFKIAAVAGLMFPLAYAQAADASDRVHEAYDEKSAVFHTQYSYSDYIKSNISPTHVSARAYDVSKRYYDVFNNALYDVANVPLSSDNEQETLLPASSPNVTSYGNTRQRPDGGVAAELTAYNGASNDGYWMEQVDTTLLAGPPGPKTGTIGASSMTPVEVPASPPDPSIPLIKVEMLSKDSPYTSQSLPIKVGTHLVAYSASETDGSPVDSELFRDKDSGEYLAQQYRQATGIDTDGTGAKITYWLAPGSESIKTLPFNFYFRSAENEDSLELGALPRRTTVQEAVDIYHDKYYSRNPIQDDEVQRFASTDPAEVRDVLRESTDTVCNTAALGVILETNGKDDHGEPLNIATGYSNNGDSVLSTDELHAWVIDNTGTVIDGVPALSERDLSNQSRPWGYTVYGLGSLALMYGAYQGIRKGGKIQKQRIINGKIPLANDVAAKYERALYRNPDQSSQMTYDDRADSDAVRRLSEIDAVMSPSEIIRTITNDNFRTSAAAHIGAWGLAYALKKQKEDRFSLDPVDKVNYTK